MGCCTLVRSVFICGPSPSPRDLSSQTNLDRHEADRVRKIRWSSNFPVLGLVWSAQVIPADQLRSRLDPLSRLIHRKPCRCPRSGPQLYWKSCRRTGKARTIRDCPDCTSSALGPIPMIQQVRACAARTPRASFQDRPALGQVLVGQPIWLQAGSPAGWTRWKGRPQAELPAPQARLCRAA
jgi:hypothetical protein